MPDPVVLARTVFAAAWIGLQAALVTTAGSRPDAAFGFRMFSESSTIEVHLSRTVVRRRAARATERAGESTAAEVTREIPVDNGQWTTREPGPGGRVHTVSWRDRVKDPLLASFDRTFHASYSAGAQVSRWQAALADVAAHLEPDGETRALNLDITISRNGREPVTTRTTVPVAVAPASASAPAPAGEPQ